MTEREYDVTVTTDFSKIHRVRARNINEAKRKIQRLLRNEDVEILETFDGGVGSETIRMVEPVVPGPHERWDIHQCSGKTLSGARCQRRAVASSSGYLCGQHLWQDGVEETSG